MPSNIKSVAFGAAIMVAGSFVLPAAAQDLQVLQPQALEELAGAPGATGSRGLRLLSHEDAVVAVRVWYPPNTEIAPNPNPAGKVALVTVLSGEIELGLGDEYDASKLQPVPVGSLVVLREGDPQHFGRTGPGGVELLLVAGPAGAVSTSVLSKD